MDALAEAVRLTGVETVKPGYTVREHQSIFNAIRMGLHFAANVSRVFWPASAAAKARCAHLRHLTGLSKKHPLGDRELRNHVEHFDERIDLWIASGPRPYLHYELVVYPDMPVSSHTLDACCFIYFVATNEVRLFGQTFSLSDLRKQVADVQKAASSALEKMYSSGPPPGFTGASTTP
jgi:hypothetical protein